MQKITVSITEANYEFLRSQRDESYGETVNRLIESYRDFGPAYYRFKKQLDRLDTIATRLDLLDIPMPKSDAPFLQPGYIEHD